MRTPLDQQGFFFTECEADGGSWSAREGNLGLTGGAGSDSAHTCVSAFFFERKCVSPNLCYFVLRSRTDPIQEQQAVTGLLAC